MMDVNDRIRRCVAKHPDWHWKRIASATGGHKPAIEAILRGEPVPELTPPPAPIAINAAASVAPKVKAIPLSGVHLLSKKPVDLMKGRLYGLQRGMGYPVSDLARAWGVSEETLKNHAKNHRALAYVEATPGEYVPVIVHPETPKGDSL